MSKLESGVNDATGRRTLSGIRFVLSFVISLLAASDAGAPNVLMFTGVAFTPLKNPGCLGPRGS
jgi:hypothetical protein